MSKRTMSDEEFDEYFDNGGDITEFIVEGSVHQPGLEPARKININMPSWMIEELDAYARHLAVPRQAVIIMWLADRLKTEKDGSAA